MRKTPSRRLLLATSNPAKEREFRRLVEGLPLSLSTPRDLSLHIQVPEEGATHRENALAKAVAFSQAAGGLAMATDGGLVVPALGDAWDGLRTHRFAGDVDEGAKARELLRLMAVYPAERRRISWREALAVAESGVPLASWEVAGADGYLLQERDPSRVAPDFWVAGLWFFPQVGKTYGELDERERRLVNDHWDQLRGLVQGFLRGYLTQRRISDA